MQHVYKKNTILKNGPDKSMCHSDENGEFDSHHEQRCGIVEFWLLIWSLYLNKRKRKNSIKK